MFPKENANNPGTKPKSELSTEKLRNLLEEIDKTLQNKDGNQTLLQELKETKNKNPLDRKNTKKILHLSLERLENLEEIQWFCQEPPQEKTRKLQKDIQKTLKIFKKESRARELLKHHQLFPPRIPRPPTLTRDNKKIYHLPNGGRMTIGPTEENPFSLGC
jgi:hypothetical protein